MAFADGRFDFSPVATSPRPPRKPDRFPMTALTAKDLRRASQTPVAKPTKPTKPKPVKPVVGEYCFGSRIRFDPSMLAPARRFAVAGERDAETKKKIRKKMAAAKKSKAAAKTKTKKKKSRRSESAARSESSASKPLRETEKHAEEERAKDATRLGADARRLPPKTPIRDFAKSNAFDVLQMENDDASATPTSSRAEDEITSARLFFDALAAEPSIRNPQSES
jgi:hypothetical protein